MVSFKLVHLMNILNFETVVVVENKASRTGLLLHLHIARLGTYDVHNEAIISIFHKRARFCFGTM